MINKGKSKGPNFPLPDLSKIDHEAELNDIFEAFETIENGSLELLKSPDLNSSEEHAELISAATSVLLAPSLLKNLSKEQRTYLRLALVRVYSYGQTAGYIEGSVSSIKELLEKKDIDRLAKAKETLQTNSSKETGGLKNHKVRDKALLFMQELILKNPRLSNYQLAIKTHEDSKKNPSKYEKKGGIPLSTCHKYSKLVNRTISKGHPL